VVLPNEQGTIMIGADVGGTYKSHFPLDLDRQPITVVHVDNVGREGEAWIGHILDNWERLVAFTAFLQATPDRVRMDELEGASSSAPCSGVPRTTRSAIR
jgi:hypothetical protein